MGGVTPAGARPSAHGGHTCLVVDSDDARDEAVGAFVREGLDAGERVWCFLDAPRWDHLRTRLRGEGVDVPALAAGGRLHVVPTSEVYGPDGEFRPERTAAVLADAVVRARADGCRGFRVTGEASRVSRATTAGLLLAYEALVGPALGGDGAALCEYDRRDVDPATVPAFATLHDGVHGGDPAFEGPLLRVAPRADAVGLRLEGEADVSNRDVVRRAVEPLLAHGGDVRLDLSGLRFLDVTVASTLVLGAQRLPAGRRLVVEEPPRALRRMLAVRAWGALSDVLEVR